MDEIILVKTEDVLDFFRNREGFFIVASELGLTIKSKDPQIQLKFRFDKNDL